MRTAHTVLSALGLVAALMVGVGQAAQTTQRAGTIEETINVTGRGIPEALDVIMERYGVPIDYIDPVYASNMDTQLLYVIHGKRVPVPPVVPKIYTIHFQYDAEKGPSGSETVGPPVGGMTAMIQKLLDEFAAQGGTVFGVRKFTMPYGPRWEVYPVKVRNAHDIFVNQPDFLGATIRIPPANRTQIEMLDRIAQQLTQIWGRKFRAGSTGGLLDNDVGLPAPSSTLGAMDISAREALLKLSGALRMEYEIRDDTYWLSLIRIPSPPPPRPSVPPPPPPVSSNGRVPPIVWLNRSRTRTGTLVIQTALSRAGYLHTIPTTQWDATAADAIRRFQTANALPATGSLDPMTILKLEPFLPKLIPERKPYFPMSPALAYWLQSTRRGWRDIQLALTKAGFYSGNTTGQFDKKTHEALKAFQQANGLPVNGDMDYKTAEKLSWLLPKAN